MELNFRLVFKRSNLMYNRIQLQWTKIVYDERIETVNEQLEKLTTNS